MSGSQSEGVFMARTDSEHRLIIEHLILVGTGKGVMTVCGQLVPDGAQPPPKGAGRCKVCTELDSADHPSRRLR